MTRRFFLIAIISAWAGCILPAIALGYNAVLWGSHHWGKAPLGPAPDMAELLWKLAALVVLIGTTAWATFCAWRAGGHSIENLSQEQADALDRLPDRWLNWAIAGSAALSLVLELVLIRWQGLMVPMFSFYKNFGLLACFTGLGLGFALSGRRHVPLLLTIPLLVWQMALFLALSGGSANWKTGMRASPILEQFNMGGPLAKWAPIYAFIMLFLAVTFALTALALVPVGQACGRLMDRRTDKLRSYGLNLLGSLAGIGLMLGMSDLWTPPVIWFALCWIGLLALQAFRRRTLIFGAICGLIGIVALAWPTTFLWEQIYSPYQLIERGPGERGLSVLKAGGLYHQRINDLDSKAPELQPVIRYYEFPYRVAGKPGEVAVVGAGTGNDVAAALRMGADRVDAIEIDPAIQAVGQAYHPNQPYQNPKTRAIINDARSHLRTTERQYDMIVYGLLDSHTLLGSASNIRLDSYVYTVEGLKEAQARLKDGGILSLSFCVLWPEIGRKFYLMLEQAFGQPPVCIEAGYDLSVMFLVRNGAPLKVDPDLCAASGFRDVTARFADPALRADIATDDWPFVYMPRRVYPYSYLAVMGMLLVLAVGLAAGLAPARPRRGQAPFFFLGAGFMLVETKSITELGLTFGNTWQIIGVVIAGILAMAFLANWVAGRFRIERPEPIYLFLVASLALGWFLSGRFGSTLTGRLAAVVVLTMPLFFSGLAFSSLLRSSAEISGAMAANLIGAIVGGILEYNSMYFGFRALYVIAIVLYVAAYLTSRQRSPAAQEPLSEPHVSRVPEVGSKVGIE